MGSIEDIRKNWHSYNAQDVKWIFNERLVLHFLPPWQHISKKICTYNFTCRYTKIFYFLNFKILESLAHTRKLVFAKSQKYSFAKINLVKVYQFKKIKNNDLQTNLMQKLKENLRTFKEILDFEDIKRQGGMSSEFSDYFREISKMKEN